MAFKALLSRVLASADYIRVDDEPACHYTTHAPGESPKVRLSPVDFPGDEAALDDVEVDVDDWGSVSHPQLGSGGQEFDPNTLEVLKLRPLTAEDLQDA